MSQQPFQQQPSSPTTTQQLFKAGGDGQPSSTQSTPSRKAHLIHRQPESFSPNPFTLTDEQKLEQGKQRLTIVQQNFKAWDKDNDGVISTNDASEVLKSSQFTSEEIQAILASMPSEQGRITYESFKDCLLKKMSLQYQNVAPPADIMSELEDHLRSAKRAPHLYNSPLLQPSSDPSHFGSKT